MLIRNYALGAQIKAFLQPARASLPQFNATFGGGLLGKLGDRITHHLFHKLRRGMFRLTNGEGNMLEMGRGNSTGFKLVQALKGVGVKML